MAQATGLVMFAWMSCRRWSAVGLVAFAILVALIGVLAYLAWRYALIVTATRAGTARPR